MILLNIYGLLYHLFLLFTIAKSKLFSVFSEVVTESEYKEIPEFAKNHSDNYATKFQIVLRGDTRKPLKMIKSFKWLALDTEIASAQNFVDTIPVPVEGEEGLTIEELIQLRAEQAAAGTTKRKVEEEEKSWFGKLKDKFNKTEEK